MRTLNPFKGLDRPLHVWAWGMYDLANQSFTLLVVTLFLPIYLKNVVVPQAGIDPDRALVMLSWAVAFSSGVVVLLGPVLGALTDFAGRKKLALTLTGIGCAVLTMALSFMPASAVAWTLIFFALANVLFMLGENFLASFLPEISSRETLGRVSAIGWTMGYVGAIVCLPMALLLPGVRAGAAHGYQWIFFFAGAWFLICALPTFLILRESKAAEALPPGRTLWTIGPARLLETAREAGAFRQLAIFLAFFCVYCCGMQVIINFSGLLASQYIKEPMYLIGFVLALAMISAAGSAVSGLVQDRIGQRLTVQISLAVWIATSIAAALLPSAGASWAHLGLVGAGIGLGLGLTGPASRALVGVLTPAHKTAEFFSLWGLGYKVAGVIGPLVYGVVYARAGQQWAMGSVGLFFIVGLAGTFLIDMRAGREAAERSERQFADRIDQRDFAAAARMGAGEMQSVNRAATPRADR